MNDRELIARTAYEALHRPSFGWPAWDDPANDLKGQYYAIATAMDAAIGDRLLPGIPDTVKRVQIVPGHWHVEFYYHAFPKDNGEIWQDFGGDYQSARFALAATVCEIPEAGEWPEWNCYPDEDGWVCFADDPRGEIGGPLPQGCGIGIPSAIRNALEGGTE